MKRSVMLLALVCALLFSGCSKQAGAALDGQTYLEHMTAQAPETVEIHAASVSKTITNKDDIRQIMQLLSGLSVSEADDESLMEPGAQSLRVIFIDSGGSETSVTFPCFAAGDSVYSIQADDPAIRQLSGYIDCERAEQDRPAQREAQETEAVTAVRTITRIRPYTVAPSLSHEGRLGKACALYCAPVETGTPLSELAMSTSVKIYCTADVSYSDAEQAERWCFVRKTYGEEAGWVRQESVQPGLPTSETVQYAGPYWLVSGAVFYDVDLMTGERTAQVFSGETGSGSLVWNHGFDERVWLWHFVGNDGYEIWVDTLDALEQCMESCIQEPPAEEETAHAAAPQTDAGARLQQETVSKIVTDSSCSDANLRYVGQMIAACCVYAAPVESDAPLDTLEAGSAVELYFKARVSASDEEQTWYLIGTGESVGWVQEAYVRQGLTDADRMQLGPYRMKDGAPYFFVNTMTRLKEPQIFDAQTDPNALLWNFGYDELMGLWHLVGCAGWEVWVEDLSDIEAVSDQTQPAP